MISKNKELYEETDSMSAEVDRLSQIIKAFEDQIQVLTEQNQNLKETATVDKLQVKELEQQIHELSEELQIKDKVIEEYEVELGIVVQDGIGGEQIRG